MADAAQHKRRSLVVGNTAIGTSQTIASVQCAPGFSATVNGLLVDGAPSFDAWNETIKNLSVVEKGSPFAIGDAIRYGEQRFGEQASQALGPEHGWSEKTIGVYVWLAERIAPDDRRMDRLGVKHHLLVARLTPTKQRLWLTRAAADDEEKPWTAARLKQALEEGEDAPVQDHYVLVGPLNGQVQDQLMERLEAEGLTVKAIDRRRRRKEPVAA